ncbi:Disease resistance protein [Ilyonectria robusta]
MDNNPPLPDLWREAYNRCLKRLPAKDVAAVLRANSYDELKESISSSNRKLMNSAVRKALAKIEPFLSSIRQFFSVIDSMVQANPEIAALVWGSIKFLFELSDRIQNATEQVADGLVDISNQMPRFEAYRNMFDKADRLTRALVDLYEAIAQFCIDCAARSQIVKASRFVDVEAVACNMELDGLRFEQVMSVLNQSSIGDKQPNTNTIRIPCHQIPYDRNPTFFARSQELGVFYDTLLDPAAKSSNLRWLSLHGDGGVGKTSIALEFVHRHKDAYDVIAWFQADKVLKLERGFKDFAAHLGVHKDKADAKLIKERS